MQGSWEGGRGRRDLLRARDVSVGSGKNSQKWPILKKLMK